MARGSWLVGRPRLLRTRLRVRLPLGAEGFGELESGFAEERAILVAASTDSYWSHKAWLETHPLLGDITFPVIADTTRALALDYGVLGEDGSAPRATFIIDPEGLVRHATISDLNVGRSPEETLRVLQALRTERPCPVGWHRGRPMFEAA